MDVIDFKLFWKQLQKHGKIMFIYDYFIIRLYFFYQKVFSICIVYDRSYKNL